MKTHAKIYVMRAKDGTLKLGHSKRPPSRAKELGLDIVHQTDVLEHAERIERLAHRVLALHGKHIRGERFEASLDDAIHAIEIATRQAEMQELPLGKSVPSAGVYAAKLEPVAIRLPAEMVRKIDELRASRLDAPDKSTIIRELLAKALK